MPASGTIFAAAHHGSVDAALRSAAAVTGMELAFLGHLDDTTFTFARVVGARPWPGVEEGQASAAADSMCHRLLAGAPWHTADAAADPAYAPLPSRREHGVTSYAGAEVLGPDGTSYGALCAMDRSHVEVAGRAHDVLNGLAAVVSARLSDAAVPAVVRTAKGWRVTGGSDVEADADDLTSAMVLADLLAAEAGATPRGSRPPRRDDAGDEIDRLLISVAQLEHALAARVVVEQAIGVLAERRRVSPRSAFETLRGIARGSGRRVHDLAREVVASASVGPGSPTLPTLPAGLARGGGVPSPAAVAGAVRGVPRPGPRGGQPPGS